MNIVECYLWQKFLNSDWLRAVHFQGNTVRKKVTIICTKLAYFGIELPLVYFCIVLVFLCTLLTGNSMVSHSIWQNMHSETYQRLQTTLPWPSNSCYFDSLWRTHLYNYVCSKLHLKPCYYYLYLFMLLHIWVVYMYA